MSYTQLVALYRAGDDAAYIRSRSTRYAGAVDIEPAWTLEVLADERLVELTPYPTSRVGASGFIGYSPSAGTGRDLATYQMEARDDGEEA